MRLLLDTHAIIWHTDEYEALSETASKVLENPANQFYISAVSLWEIAIKASSGKLKFPYSLRDIIIRYETSGATLLPITPAHTLVTETLPWHHRDPFDRMLIAQAIHEDLILVSKDHFFAQYPVLTLW